MQRPRSQRNFWIVKCPNANIKYTIAPSFAFPLSLYFSFAVFVMFFSTVSKQCHDYIKAVTFQGLLMDVLCAPGALYPVGLLKQAAHPASQAHVEGQERERVSYYGKTIISSFSAYPLLQLKLPHFRVAYSNTKGTNSFIFPPEKLHKYVQP